MATRNSPISSHWRRKLTALLSHAGERPTSPTIKIVAKRDSAVYVTPLGGVGEVGKNATLLECRDKLMLIDCGVQFPSAEQLGVDLIIPDFSYILQRPEQFLGLVLTHAHEDHI